MASASTAADSEPIQHIVLYHLSTPEACSALIKFMLSLKPRLSKYVLDIKCGTVKPVEPIRNGGSSFTFHFLFDFHFRLLDYLLSCPIL
jgi:hypothetical protein